MRHLILVLSLVSVSIARTQTIRDGYGEGTSANSYLVPNFGQFVDVYGDPMDDLKYVGVGSVPEIGLGANSTLSFFWTIEDSVAPRRARVDVLPMGEEAQLVDPSATDLAPGVDNYYYPHCPSGILNVKRYVAAAYEELFAKVDEVVYSTPAGLRLSLICEPGFDPDGVYFKFLGQDSLEVDVEGTLKLYDSGSFLELREAFAYQIDSADNIVPLSWGGEWEGAGETGVARLIFDEFDEELPVVLQIGPPPLAAGGLNLNEGLGWSTSFGTDYEGDPYPDHLGGAVTAADGSLYVAGSHCLGTFPPIPGWVAFSGEDWDIFFGHYLYDPGNSSTDAVQEYMTHFGGTGDEQAEALYLSNDGATAYIGGYGNSVVLPVQPTIDPADDTYWEDTKKGTTDGLLVRLNPANGDIMNMAYFGGGGGDMITAFTEDEGDNIWFSGITDSSSGTEDDCNSPSSGFPLCDPPGTNYFQASNGGGRDAFLTRLDDDFAMTYSSFYGGTEDDACYDMAYIPAAIPSLRRIMLTGQSTGTVPASGTGDFYLTGNGEKSGFIATFDYDAKQTWSTNVQKLHSLQAIARRNTELLVLGYSHSTNTEIWNEDGSEPSASPVQLTCADANGYVSICDPGGGAYFDATPDAGDVYIAEFQPVTGELLWSTFIGNEAEEFPAVATYQFNGVALDEPFHLRRYEDLQVDQYGNFYAMATTTKMPAEPVSYPTLEAPPFYYKEVDNSVGDDQSDITLHGFRGGTRGIYWATTFGAFAPHVDDPIWDYYYLSDGCDLGASLALAGGEALYWTGATGNDRFPTQCPYPGTSYCEPYSEFNAKNWQCFATRMSLIGVAVGEEDALPSFGGLSCTPVPAQDEVLVTFQSVPVGRAMVRIFDAAGRLVDVLAAQNGRIHIGHLPAGSYRAQVLEPSGRALGSVPLVKVH